MTSHQEIVLKADGLSKSYQGHLALSELTFEMRAGEIMGLLGPNGAGKTTAMRILTTILPATAGQFSVMGIPNNRAGEIRALIGMLPESSGFPGAMTGIAYLTYMGELYGMSQAAAREKSAELLQTFGLAGPGQKPIGTYSRGMRQRLGIARSLINDPKLLFLDEPTLGFDPIGQREMLQFIKRIAVERGTAIMISSHLLDVVEAICDEVLVLKQGRVIAQDSVRNITTGSVTVEQSYRVVVPLDARQKATQSLVALPNVTVELDAQHSDQLLISVLDKDSPAVLNRILGELIAADIPIQALVPDTVRLDDAFQSMIEGAAV